MIGTSLAHYRVTGRLGAGGMGEVWRAEDTRLGRDVALKLLPAEFAENSERLARFEREAKVLASLNHPNIAHLYGLETAIPAPASTSASDPSGTGTDTGTVTFLVMELVEGEGLDEVISRGPVPVNEAIPIALQIAEALEAAHEAGIVHRDLKPANVKIRPDGTVKVLDFGLAKAWDEGEGADVSLSPTLTRHATAAGVILGTAAYMSPEQAKGKPVDRRADMWSFGVVLWEMLTGRTLFDGETVTEVLASVLKETPDLDALPDDLSPPLRRLVARCLERDPRRRLRDIGEARLVLDDLQEGRVLVDAGPAIAAPAESTPPPSILRRALPWAVAVAATVVAVVAWLPAPEPAATSRRLVASILPPTEGGFDADAGLALSPDGQHLVVAALDADDNRELWLHELATGHARPLDGTRGAFNPFWSPDGRFVAYFLDDGLKRIDPASNVTETLARNLTWTDGGSWSADGTVVVGTAWADRMRVLSTSDSPRLPEPRSGPDLLAWPDFLPDGEHYVFLARQYTSEDEGGEIRIASGTEPEQRVVMPSNSNPLYAEPGYLLWWSDGNLRAQRFDADRLELTGESTALIPDVRFNPNIGRMAVTVSDTGRLVYQRGGDVGSDEMVLVDRRGDDVGRVTEPGTYYGPRLSPDGRWVVADVSDASNKGDLWLYDLERGAGTRLTFAAEDETRPRWSPTGNRVAYSAYGATDRMEVWVRDVRGRGEARSLASDADAQLRVTDWVPGGAILVDRMTGEDVDMYVLFDGDDELRPWLATDFLERSASASPDGEFVAYVSEDSGRPEVWLRSFPDGERAWRVSVGGGDWPAWRDDGAELYYVGPDAWLTAVPIAWIESAEGREPTFGTPERLFRFECKWHHDRQWDTRDGEVFLLNRLVRTGTRTPLTVVQGWLPE